jgi:hypothetical protein
MLIARSAARQSSAESARLRASCTNEQHARTSFDQARVFLTQPAWEWVRARTLNARERVAETPSRDFGLQVSFTSCECHRVQRGVRCLARLIAKVLVSAELFGQKNCANRFQNKVHVQVLANANYPKHRGDRRREKSRTVRAIDCDVVDEPNLKALFGYGARDLTSKI